jgi:hypothetical protein
MIRTDAEDMQIPPETALAALEGVELEDLRLTPTSDRFETKFVGPTGALGPLLDACGETGYRVLRINGAAVQRYHTAYYDTADLAFYHAHHAGRAVRIKVRTRRYEATGARFIEVKHRQSSGRTLKFRAPLTGDIDGPIAASQLLPPEARPLVEGTAARPVLHMVFDRITLASPTLDERVTIDLRLGAETEDRRVALDGPVFVEAKQYRRRMPAFHKAMAAPRPREQPASKYCVAVALLYPAHKHNGFKPLLRRLHALRAPECSPPAPAYQR